MCFWQQCVNVVFQIKTHDSSLSLTNVMPVVYLLSFIGLTCHPAPACSSSVDQEQLWSTPLCTKVCAHGCVPTLAIPSQYAKLTWWPFICCEETVYARRLRKSLMDLVTLPAAEHRHLRACMIPQVSKSSREDDHSAIRSE